MGDTSVDRFYVDGGALVSAISTIGDPSSLVFAQDLFRKSLLLSIASYFEKRVIDIILSIVARNLPEAHPSWQFCNNKALVRQYHQLFEWDRQNANKFFSFFGVEFRNFMVARIKDSEALSESIQAFLQLGQLRNQMVHGNFDSFFTDDTADELFVKFELANSFIEDLPIALHEHLKAFDTTSMPQ